MDIFLIFHQKSVRMAAKPTTDSPLMRNFLTRNMAVATIMLSFAGVTQTASAQSNAQYQDLNDLDVVINNLIAVRHQAPMSAAQASAEPVSVYNAYQPQVTTGGSASNYVNPFSSGSLAREAVASSTASKNTAPYLMAAHVARHAHNSSTNRCALYVRRALQAAGYKVTPQASAYMYNNGELAKVGFKKIPTANYTPEVGDVVVFNKTPKNPHGHIQVYTGTQWVSDFKQPSMMVYGSNHRGYTIWRDGRYVDASMRSNPTYLAMNN